MMFSDSHAIDRHPVRPAGSVRRVVRDRRGAARTRRRTDVPRRPQRGRVRCGRARRGIDPRRGGTTRRRAWPVDAAAARRWRDERRRRPCRRRRRPCGGGTVVRYRRRERAAVDGRVRPRRRCRSHHPHAGRPRCEDHPARRVTRVPLAAHGAGAGGVPRHRRRRYPPQSKDPAVLDRARRVLDGTDMDADYWAAQITSTVRFADAITTATTADAADPPRRTRPAVDPAGPCPPLRCRHADPHPGAVRRAGRRRRGFRAGRRTSIRRRADHPIRQPLP